MTIHARSTREFHQMAWDDALASHVEAAARQWLAEDLGAECDWTSVGLIAAGQCGQAEVRARSAGVVAGIEAARIVAAAVDESLEWTAAGRDGDAVEAGASVARLSGPVRSMLAAERTILNVMGRLSGIASAVRRLVDAVAGTDCRVYDTRKTVPGWRLLDKYAVRCGGGWNHRMGLFDAILIKDNHLAAAAEEGLTPADAVRRAREFVLQTFPAERAAATVVEIEVDSLTQLEQVLPAGPDIVLLDNMGLDDLRVAVAKRDGAKSPVVLEASGGIHPDTVGAIAKTGVDRVSTGWPCHHAPWLDLGLDWAAS
jgi:nicotinate-nucleotide pyrophosphorylase (carboxylating)